MFRSPASNDINSNMVRNQLSNHVNLTRLSVGQPNSCTTPSMTKCGSSDTLVSIPNVSTIGRPEIIRPYRRFCQTKLTELWHILSANMEKARYILIKLYDSKWLQLFSTVSYASYA